ncbi:MAG: glycoside hydrolase family 15 protein, partial [Caulobacteraceae bacterium]
MTSTIPDYAIIGDGRSCALISRTGSIDFLCWPRFDSDACLMALLGDERHGHWLISPAGYVSETTRSYREDTAILKTEHVSDTGRVCVTDLMPWHDGASSIIRIVEGLEGEVEMTMSLRLRFGYGQIKPWQQRHERGLIFEVGPDRIVLDSPIELTVTADEVSARFMLAKGAKVAFVLGYSPAAASLPSPLKVDALIRATEKAWKGWVGRFEAKCPWAGAVRRSLITLHMLIDRDSGGIVAAATLGLPEISGGSANWDYRYCWLRDSTFTLTALLNAGFHEEAPRWRDWILRAVAGAPARMQIVYRIDGRRRLSEYELDGLPGYQGATPVRVGNAASGQTQLDVFGELMDSFDVLAKAGIARTPRVVELEIAIVQHLEKVWDQPSSDIWESRGEEQCYTYSQVMAWVGV